MTIKQIKKPVAIKVSGVKKMYRLGQIGGGSLQADLQSWWARVRGKDDPNSIIGENQRSNGKTFMALNGIDLTVYQGEAIGIIGSNGAGKSTLLKLFSKVTAPTEGEIDIYGRIASMLEVGTGFNGELTGRENVYLNGAILGMNKQEIDAKMEQIIEFSEIREFIDTPVKRYSSGMFVKLAFSVAAHLDSEIMIMDEVLAVGDMAFQNKCLKKMKEVANEEGRTVLYVSHNMNTIRKLCDRCIVLEKGKMVYDGDVDNAIDIYLGTINSIEPVVDLTKIPRRLGEARMTRLEVDCINSVVPANGTIKGKLTIESEQDYDDVAMEFVLLHSDQVICGMRSPQCIKLVKDEKNEVNFEVDLSGFAPTKYSVKLVIFQINGEGGIAILDLIKSCYIFDVYPIEGFNYNLPWYIEGNGFFVGKELKLL